MEAVLEASVLRLRPILMTTGAMVLGAVPLAMATGPGAEARNDIGWVIVGGMTVGTLFTLVRRSHGVHVPGAPYTASGRTATRRAGSGEPALATQADASAGSDCAARCCCSRSPVADPHRRRKPPCSLLR